MTRIDIDVCIDSGIEFVSPFVTKNTDLKCNDHGLDCRSLAGQFGHCPQSLIYSGHK